MFLTVNATACAGLTEAATRSASAFTESLHAGGSAFAPLPAACAFAAWGKAHRVVSTSTATAKISARDFFSWRDRRKCRIGQREIQFRFANRHSSTALSREVRGHKRRVCGEQIHLRDLADLAFERPAWWLEPASWAFSFAAAVALHRRLKRAGATTCKGLPAFSGAAALRAGSGRARRHRTGKLVYFAACKAASLPATDFSTSLVKKNLPSVGTIMI